MRALNLFSIIMTALSLCLFSCAGKNSDNTVAEKKQSDTYNAKAIVCYFSATGTTAEQAGRLARLIGADSHEIVPAQRYSDADLDWRDTLSRCYVEMHNRDMRPAIENKIDSIDKYSVVFIGYPNWWNTAPTIINTFIESNNLKGKTIVPFMTSGGDDISNSEKDLKTAYPDLKFATGLLMNAVSDNEILEWTNPILKTAE